MTNAHIRNGGACSVIGRSVNSSGDPADISASADGQVLQRQNGALAFADSPIQLSEFYTLNYAVPIGGSFEGAAQTGQDDACWVVPAGRTAKLVMCTVGARTGATAGTYTVKGRIKNVGAGTYIEACSATAAQNATCNPSAVGTIASPVASASYAAGVRLKFSVLNDGTSPGALAAVDHTIRAVFAII